MSENLTISLICFVLLCDPCYVYLMSIIFGKYRTVPFACNMPCNSNVTDPNRIWYLYVAIRAHVTEYRTALAMHNMQIRRKYP
jgi:hypothetical protein